VRKPILLVTVAFVSGVVLGVAIMFVGVVRPRAREYAELDRLRAEQRRSLYSAFEHALADARAAGERAGVLAERARTVIARAGIIASDMAAETRSARAELYYLEEHLRRAGVID